MAGRFADRIATALPELLLVVIYLVVAIGFGEHYPLSPLEMFADAARRAAYYGVTTGSGVFQPDEHFVDWHCPVFPTKIQQLHPECLPPVNESRATWGWDGLRSYMKSHWSDRDVGEETVHVVARIYELEKPHCAIRFSDCEVITCTAHRR